MKSLLAAVIVLLLTPSPAHAEASITMRDVPLSHGIRTLASAAPIRFDMVGLHWRGAGSVQFRTRSLSGRWSSWHAAAPEDEDRPDVGTAESNAARGWRLGNPYWTGTSNAIAYRLRGRVTRLRAYFVWSPVDALPPRRLSIAGSPQIIPRAAWGADESIRRAAPRYADTLRFAVVHHTAGTNAYSPSQSAAIVRGIEVYHVKGNGWNDIGYNFLVDRYGQVFEGRYGGMDRNVIGAHAEGFNTGSVGVAVIGTYTSAPPPVAAETALTDLLAWRLDFAHVDPLSTVVVASGGNARFPPGMPVVLRAVSGHRDTGFTSCPGAALYAQLGAIASTIAATGLPKLYAPTVTGEPGGPVEFKAMLTTALPWSVTVTDGTGATIASGSGVGTDVEWIWDASNAARARYAWTMSAGADVRPATGFVGAAPVPLAVQGAGVNPVAISPNGDGFADRSTVTYTLTAPATVTATLRSSDGRSLATLFKGRLAAGKHTFGFAGAAVPDGRYGIVIAATDGKTTVTASATVLVDRTLASPRVTPAAFSPNGDGRRDALTFSFQLARPAHIRIDAKLESRLVSTVFAGDLGAGAQSVPWDGLGDGKRVADGSYAAVVTSRSPFGTTAYSLPFRIDTVPPRLTAISFRRLVFRVSEPALLTVVVNGRRHVRSVQAGVVSFHFARIVRRVRVSATDAAGNVSRTLRFP